MIMAPSAKTITPNSGTSGNAVSLTIDGNGLAKNAHVWLTKSGQTNITATNVVVLPILTDERCVPDPPECYRKLGSLAQKL